jgi:hypothetical protein
MSAVLLELDRRPRLVSDGSVGPLRSHVRVSYTRARWQWGCALGAVVNRGANEWVRWTDVHIHLLIGTISVGVRRALLPWLQ